VGCLGCWHCWCFPFHFWVPCSVVGPGHCLCIKPGEPRLHCEYPGSLGSGCGAWPLLIITPACLPIACVALHCGISAM
jgi:hypothetical protein